MAEGHSHYLEPGHLIGHVKDAEYFEVPRFIADEGKLKIYQPFDHVEPVTIQTGFEPVDQLLEKLDFRITKFMILEVVAAILICAIFITLARRIKTGERPTGKFWNFFEGMLLFMRDQVARPAIGKADADKFLPFLWSLFAFILMCNLLGMIPWAGSPTGAWAATGILAVITLVVVCAAGVARMGPVGFLKNQVPHMDLPLPFAVTLKPMIFAIEILGMFIKHFVLSVRLLANMLAGHLVLAVIIAFIGATAGSAVWYGVMPASLLGATALSMLELFVAFLQAYIFTFLAALFIGMAVHPH